MGSEDIDKMGRRTIDRRTLIKRATAAGGAAWAAPVILASLPSPVAAQSATAGCYKFMFDWRWAPNVHACANGLGSPQNDATPCAQNFGENHHNIQGVQQKIPGVNCCEDKAPIGAGGEGNVLQWYEFPDIPPGCVVISSSEPCATSTTDLDVMISIVCPGCYITDGLVRYDSSGTLPALPPNANYCAVASLSETGFASSKLISGAVTISFSPPKVPVWFKFFIACGVDPNHPQNDGYFPDTDCQIQSTDSVTI